MAVDAAPATVEGQQARHRLLDCAAVAVIRTSSGSEREPIARGADVVPSMICHYFNSKAGLVSTLIEDFF